MANGLSDNVDGREIPDSTPVAVPVGFKRPKPLNERVRELVRNELLARELSARGVETFEEADDFELPDDPLDQATPYEDQFDPEHPGIIAREQEIRSGFVEDIPLERKESARERIAEAKRRKSGVVEREPVGLGGDSRQSGGSDGVVGKAGSEVGVGEALGKSGRG